MLWPFHPHNGKHQSQEAACKVDSPDSGLPEWLTQKAESALADKTGALACLAHLWHRQSQSTMQENMACNMSYIKLQARNASCKWQQSIQQNGAQYSQVHHRPLCLHPFLVSSLEKCFGTTESLIRSQYQLHYELWLDQLISERLPHQYTFLTTCGSVSMATG